MEKFESRKFGNDISNLYRGKFTHDIGSGSNSVEDELITTLEVATARAKSELVKNGYKERVVNIQSIHIQGLKQNDIISFNNENWIVKEIALNYTPPTLTSSIQGVRYDG